MNKSPAVSTATPVGLLRIALNAPEPSPLPLAAPPPATVETKLQPGAGVVSTPFTVVLQGVVLNFRMRLLPLSAMYKKVPVESMAKPRGALNCAVDPSVLSVLPDDPRPATVVMMPVLSTTLRIRL